MTKRRLRLTTTRSLLVRLEARLTALEQAAIRDPEEVLFAAAETKDAVGRVWEISRVPRPLWLRAARRDLLALPPRLRAGDAAAIQEALGFVRRARYTLIRIRR